MSGGGKPMICALGALACAAVLGAGGVHNHHPTATGTRPLDVAFRADGPECDLRVVAGIVKTSTHGKRPLPGRTGVH